MRSRTVLSVVVGLFLLSGSSKGAAPPVVRPDDPLPEGAVADWARPAWSTEPDWLAFSPDGKKLASGGAGGIRLWDVATGRVIPTPHLEQVDVLACGAAGCTEAC